MTSAYRPVDQRSLNLVCEQARQTVSLRDSLPMPAAHTHNARPCLSHDERIGPFRIFE